jgi:hypothetical protein
MDPIDFAAIARQDEAQADDAFARQWTSCLLDRLHDSLVDTRRLLKRQRSNAVYQDPNWDLVSLDVWIIGIAKRARLRRAHLVIAMEYVMRLCPSKVPPTSRNLFRITLVALLLAVKFAEDMDCTPASMRIPDWSLIGCACYSTADITRFEADFLHTLDYNMFVDTDTYVQTYCAITGALLSGITVVD